MHKVPTIHMTTVILYLIIITTTISPSPVSASTIAVTATTICGITAGQPPHTIQCYNHKHNQTILIHPNISYHSISAAHNFFCALPSPTTTLLCWDTTSFKPKRLHSTHNHILLSDLSAGTSHVCALQSKPNTPICFRLFTSPPPSQKFITITSGKDFSCGILMNNKTVSCWGSNHIMYHIQNEFHNATMISLVAGEFHACGLTNDGILICKGSNASGQLNVPPHSPFEFSELALGANHTCAIRRENGLVICWGGLEFMNVMKNTSFETIVAGMDVTCGVSTKNFSLICWGGGFGLGSVVPLPMMIPGPCVQSSCDVCGVYPNSDSLCGGSGSICRLCEGELPIAALLPPISNVSKRNNMRFLVCAIVGSVGMSVGICSVVYFLCNLGVCGFLHKKIHNSSNPAITRPTEDTIMAPNYIAPSSRSSSRKFMRQRSGTSSKHSHSDKAERYSLLELSTATNNFSLENKIGGGSFGTVYKGILSYGREVAIKRGHITSKINKFQEKESAFDSELALLSRVHHKHLVELVGFCEENDERLLVYEYMSNGSLHDHLHKYSRSILNSWKIRIQIALGAARGIEYLHNYAVPPIIHRDIKSSNILIDSNWISKVSDFGLSLMGPWYDQELSTKAVGTVGYIDPEYYVLNILTTKSDVYGLGVVLLELLTGKRAVFKEGGVGPTEVVEFVRPKIFSGDLKSVLDNRVGPPEMEELAAVEVVAYTAMQCVSLEGKERPNVAEIVANLEKAVAICDPMIFVY